MDQDMAREEVSPIVPSTGGMIDMSEVLNYKNLLHVLAYYVARDGPEVERRAEIRWPRLAKENYQFLKPGDQYHLHYLHRVMVFKTLLQAQIPGLPCLMIEVHPSIVFFADMTAQGVALSGPEYEKELLADATDMVHEYHFIKPDDPFHALYQHRLTEHRRTKLQVPAKIPSVTSTATATPAAGPSRGPSPDSRGGLRCCCPFELKFLAWPLLLYQIFRKTIKKVKQQRKEGLKEYLTVHTW